MKGNYAKIYRELDKEGLATEKLRIADMHLLAYLMDDCEFYKSERGYYAPSQQHYADLFHTDIRTIRKMFKALESMGLITVASHKKGFAKNYDVASPEEAYNILRQFNLKKMADKVAEMKEEMGIEEVVIEQAPEVAPTQSPVTEEVKEVLIEAVKHVMATEIAPPQAVWPPVETSYERHSNTPPHYRAAQKRSQTGRFSYEDLEGYNPPF